MEKDTEQIKLGSNKYRNYRITNKKRKFENPDELMDLINLYLINSSSHEAIKHKIVYDKKLNEQVLVQEKYMTKNRPITLSGLSCYIGCDVNTLENLKTDNIEDLKMYNEEREKDYEIRKEKFQEIKEILGKFSTIELNYLEEGMLSGDIPTKAGLSALCNKYKDKYQEKTNIDHTSAGNELKGLELTETQMKQMAEEYLKNKDNENEGI